MVQDEDKKSTEHSEERVKQAQEIKDSIRSLEKELEDIQSSCQHKEYSIKNCQSETRGFSLRRVCKKCSKEIGYPTQEETDSWAAS